MLPPFCDRNNEDFDGDCPDCDGSGQQKQPTRAEIEDEKADRAMDEAKDREAEERE